MAKLKAALLFLALVATAHGEWRIRSAESEPGRTREIEHRHLVVEDSVRGERADLDIVVFDSELNVLRLIDNPNGEPAARVFAREKYAAGVNGGYFDPKFAPIGLRMSDGKAFSPLRRARLITGVLVASTRGIKIERVGDFAPLPVFSMAIQCGPFLVDGGRAVRGLDDSRFARRTFVAVARNKRAALGVCSEVSLAQLSQILTILKLKDGVKIDRALNLDGGSSSAFWFVRPLGDIVSISEQKPVRDFVAVVPK